MQVAIKVRFQHFNYFFIFINTIGRRELCTAFQHCYCLGGLLRTRRHNTGFFSDISTYFIM